MRTWGGILARWALFPAMLIVLGACSFSMPAFVTSNVLGCAQVDQKALKFVNWTQVPEVNVRIRHDEFSPMVLRLRQGWPYVMRIRNRDQYTHYIQAYEFFSNVAVIRASVGGRVFDNNCFGVLVLPPRQTVELRLVAAIDGYYEYDDNLYPFLGGFTFGPQGVIIIEERNPRI